MTTNKSPSLVFDTMDAIFELLVSYQWPPHPVTGEVPPVIYGDDPENASEEICLIGVPDGQATNARWATNLSQDETFVLRLIIFSRVPNMDRPVVVPRLRALANAVQIVIRDQTSGRVAGDLAAAVPGIIPSYIASRVAPRYFVGPAGLCGDCEIDLTFTARL